MSLADWLATRTPALSRPLQWPRTIQMIVASAVVALIAVLALWAQSPAYRVLFSNLTDRDGGAIVNALVQMNIPYQLSDTGQAILVPADKVHEARLHLAQQGLPRSGEAGFELLDNMRLGSSQFAEQITYQRALEGELANTIQALHAIQSARVHLAIPRESLFVRDRQSPTASVLVALHPGRSLTESQVQAIAWLVSASVPRLPASEVSVVDQNGRLLTLPDDEAGADAARQRFINDIEQRTVQRILTLLHPLVGPGNVRAQVSAEIDFSRRELTSETYRPNHAPEHTAIRSKQTRTASQHNTQPPQGVPGALSNQPPNATAPLHTPTAARVTRTSPSAPETDTSQAYNTTEFGSGSKSSDATINYELDRTVSHIKDPLGILKRLSVAVVVNYRDGSDGPEPLPAEDIEKLNQLVRQAMGYSAQRGDTLSVVNSLFNDTSIAPPSFWETPRYIDHALQTARYLLILLALYLLWQKIARPLLARLNTVAAPASSENTPVSTPDSAPEQADASERLARELSRHEDNLKTAREMAAKDPRAVAMVLRAWMEGDDDKH